MNDTPEPSPRPSRGGGIFIALLTLIGTVTGGLAGQPSIGLLSGFALGVAIAAALWWKERKR